MNQCELFMRCSFKNNLQHSAFPLSLVQLVTRNWVDFWLTVEDLFADLEGGDDEKHAYWNILDPVPQTQMIYV